MNKNVNTMDSVLLSIRPEWCEKIASGEKTIEVRKTRPKIDTPFKCYIYCPCSNPKWKSLFWLDKTHNENADTYGKVIGEFVCNRIDVIEVSSEAFNKYAEESCLTQNDFIEYCNGQDLYAWHISDLVIYDEFKELSEFYTIKKCNSCNESGYEAAACIYDAECKVPVQLTRPPQSWCYVEDGTEDNETAI